MGFALNIQAFCDKAQLSAGLVLKKVAFDGLRLVAMLTPVDTGRARANWRVTINHIDYSFDETLFDPQGSQTIGRGAAVINQSKWGDSINITNNVPYIEALEHGHSKQAPSGMLALTHQALSENLAHNIAVAGSV